MKLVKVGLRGLKGQRAEYALETPVVVLAGENGAGKSAVLEAIHAGVRGQIPGLPATGDGVMMAAVGCKLEVELQFERDGKPVFVRRAWERDRKGVVAQTLEQTVAPGVLGLRDGAAILRHDLGAIPEVWDVSEFLRLPPAGMRERILGSIGGAGDLSKWVPEGCPEWAKPSGQGVYEWLRAATRAGKDLVSEAEAEMKRLGGVLKTLEAAWKPPVDTSVLRARVDALHGGLEDARARAEREQRVAALAGDLQALRSRLIEGTFKPTVEAARAALVALEARRLEAERAHDLDRRLLAATTSLRRLYVAQPETSEIEWSEAAAKEAAAALSAKQAEHDTALATLNRLEAEERLLAKTSGPSSCPACGADLQAHAAEARTKAAAALAGGQEARKQALAAVAEAQLAVRGLSRAKAWAGWRAEEMAALATIAELKTDREKIGDVDALDAEFRAARAQLETAEGQARLRKRIDEREMDLEEARALLDEVPRTRPEAAIREDIAKLGVEIRRADDYAREFGLREEAVEELREAETRLDGVKGWLKELRAVETRYLGSVKTDLEKRCSELAGAKVELELEDARGNPTCRFVQGGVNALSLSEGERLRFALGLVAALLAVDQPAWSPLFVDRFEAVSAGRREGFLRTLVDLVKRSAISQAILAGCPDSVPEVEGVTVIRMDAAKAEEAKMIRESADAEDAASTEGPQRRRRRAG